MLLGAVALPSKKENLVTGEQLGSLVYWFGGRHFCSWLQITTDPECPGDLNLPWSPLTLRVLETSVSRGPR